MFRRLFEWTKRDQQCITTDSSTENQNGGKSQRSLPMRPRKGVRSRQKRISTNYDSLESRNLLAAIFPAYVDGKLTLGDPDRSNPYELSDTFKLESNPNSSKTVYLDFTGHYSYNNAWNHAISFPRYNTEGTVERFTRNELRHIQLIFQNVAEDFLPFDINVTTRAQSVDDLTRTSHNDEAFGIRVVVTQHTAGFGTGTGGLAKRNSFMDRRDTPTFVFNKGYNDTAWTISHEVGHTLGLRHDGLGNATYHPGVGSGETGWGPIMGGPFGKNLTQWSDGDYAGSTTREDDVAVMTRRATGVQFRADDVGNTFATASKLELSGDSVFDWGVIGSQSDVDVYQFTVGHSNLSLSVKPFQVFENLDVLAKLHSSDGTLIASSNPTGLTSATFSETLTPGTYFLSIDGVGRPGRYSDYGSMGFYSIEGKISEAPIPTTTVGEAGTMDVDGSWQTILLNETYLDPVIIAGPPTTKDAKPGRIRIRNVKSGSFEVKLDSWDYLNDRRSKEKASYFVIESGKHELEDGTKIIAKNGRLNHHFRRIGFGEHFSSNPVVFSQVVSDVGPSAVTTRIEDVQTGSFGVQIQEEEGNDGQHSVERVSFLAVERVGNADSDRLVASGVLEMNSQTTSINIADRFSTLPVLLANMQTFRGPDTATVRVANRTPNGANLFIEEEVSKDTESSHTTETIGFLALAPGSVKAIADGSSHVDLAHGHDDHDHDEHDHVPLPYSGIPFDLHDDLESDFEDLDLVQAAWALRNSFSKFTMLR